MKESAHTVSASHPFLPSTRLPLLRQARVFLDARVDREIKVVRLEEMREAVDLGMTARILRGLRGVGILRRETMHSRRWVIARPASSRGMAAGLLGRVLLDVVRAG
jgi:hypothetical protein